jgi:hypothetical protein
MCTDFVRDSFHSTGASANPVNDHRHILHDHHACRDESNHDLDVTIEQFFLLLPYHHSRPRHLNHHKNRHCNVNTEQLDMQLRLPLLSRQSGRRLLPDRPILRTRELSGLYYHYDDLRNSRTARSSHDTDHD